jgi:hypothetical protein
MSMIRKAAKLGIAMKLLDEVRKPHNQAKIKHAMSSLRAKSTARRAQPSR